MKLNKKIILKGLIYIFFYGLISYIYFHHEQVRSTFFRSYFEVMIEALVASYVFWVFIDRDKKKSPMKMAASLLEAEKTENLNAPDNILEVEEPGLRKNKFSIRQPFGIFKEEYFVKEGFAAEGNLLYVKRKGLFFRTLASMTEYVNYILGFFVVINFFQREANEYKIIHHNLNYLNRMNFITNTFYIILIIVMVGLIIYSIMSEWEKSKIPKNKKNIGKKEKIDDWSINNFYDEIKSILILSIFVGLIFFVINSNMNVLISESYEVLDFKYMDGIKIFPIFIIFLAFAGKEIKLLRIASIIPFFTYLCGWTLFSYILGYYFNWHTFYIFFLMNIIFSKVVRYKADKDFIEFYRGGESVFRIWPYKSKFFYEVFAMQQAKDEYIFFKKEYFYNLIFSRWTCLDENENIIFIAEEENKIAYIVKRFLNIFIDINPIKTDFHIYDKEMKFIGYFKRHFTVKDNYTLNILDDDDFKHNRKYLVALSILLDTAEER